MPGKSTKPQEEVLDLKVNVPQNVVFRSFPSETVVLNLETGKYHGLNPSAGRMLEALSACDSVRDAAVAVAGEYDADPQTIEADISELCRALLERGLIERDGNPPATNGQGAN